MSIATRFCIPLGTMISVSRSVLLQQTALRSGFRTCVLPLWLNIAFKVWFYVRNPLLDAAFNVSTPFPYIANNLLYLSISHQASKGVCILYVKALIPTSSRETKVRICLCEDLHI